MAWCEENQVDYLFGLARNSRLQEAIRPELTRAKALSARRQQCRCFPEKTLPDRARGHSEGFASGFSLRLWPPTLTTPSSNASMAPFTPHLRSLVRNAG